MKTTDEATPNITNSLKTLIAKAASAKDSGDAMRFSQAALNVANTVLTAKSADKLPSARDRQFQT